MRLFRNEMSIATFWVGFTTRAKSYLLLNIYLALAGSLGARPGGLARSIEKLARLNLDRPRQAFQRRDFRIALPGLHAADLRDMDPAALRDLFLGEAQTFARLPKSDAEMGHGGDRLRSRWKPP